MSTNNRTRKISLKELKESLEPPVLASDLWKQHGIYAFVGKVVDVRLREDRHGRECVTVKVKAIAPPKVKGKTIVINWNRWYLGKYVIPVLEMAGFDALDDIVGQYFVFMLKPVDEEYMEMMRQRRLSAMHPRFVPVKVLTAKEANEYEVKATDCEKIIELCGELCKEVYAELKGGSKEEEEEEKEEEAEGE